MKNQKVLISGAGIAGPALAWWLAERGFEVTVVERAPTLREGGQAVDFRGPVHRAVLERMGMWEPIHQHRTPGTDLILLNRRGEKQTVLPSVMMSGDVEILRGDLSRLLYERTAKTVTYRFDESITALEQDARQVTVRFARGAEERFDFVVGADGLHSNVRALAFGEESRFLRHHGYRLSTFSMPNVLELRGQAFTYTVPGRAAMVSSIGGPRANVQFIFEGGPLGDLRGQADRQRELLRETYRGVGWEVPRLLAELPQATDLYLDQIGTIDIGSYAKGRVVLLGDAAYGGTLGGQGTSLAIVGAYVLSGELFASGGDLGAAFSHYETRLRPYATACQQGAKRVGSFFAPRTRHGLFLRDLFYRAFTSRLLIGQFEKMVKASATGFDLPEYRRLPGRASSDASSQAAVMEAGT